MTQKSSAKNKKSVLRSGNATGESVLFTGTKVIRRPGKSKSRQETTVMQDSKIKKGEVMPTESITEQELVATSDVTTSEEESQKTPVDTPSNSTTSPPVSPRMDGFDLDGLCHNLQYTIRNAVVLCDCCVHATPEGIFDVLGRNFADTGALMWWLRRVGKAHIADSVKGRADCAVQPNSEAVFDVLARNFDNVGALEWWLHRVGKGELVPRTKHKDLVDALRIIAHNLYRTLKAEIGKPISRW